MPNDQLAQAIDLITHEIIATSNAVASEQSHPSSSADDMDRIISDGKAKVAKLRDIRNQLEDIATGMV